MWTRSDPTRPTEGPGWARIRFVPVQVEHRESCSTVSVSLLRPMRPQASLPSGRGMSTRCWWLEDLGRRLRKGET